MYRYSSIFSLKHAGRAAAVWTERPQEFHKSGGVRAQTRWKKLALRSRIFFFFLSAQETEKVGVHKHRPSACLDESVVMCGRYGTKQGSCTPPGGCDSVGAVPGSSSINRAYHESSIGLLCLSTMNVTRVCMNRPSGRYVSLA